MTDRTDAVTAVRARHPGAETFHFGDSQALSDQLLELVRTGRKRATCMPLRDVESGAEKMPVVGRRDIALNFDGSPALVIETVTVEILRFCDVGADFALAEGENDSLEGWRADHRAYFERNGGFAEDMLLVCERFTVAELLDG